MGLVDPSCRPPCHGRDLLGSCRPGLQPWRVRGLLSSYKCKETGLRAKDTKLRASNAARHATTTTTTNVNVPSGSMFGISQHIYTKRRLHHNGQAIRCLWKRASPFLNTYIIYFL